MKPVTLADEKYRFISAIMDKCGEVGDDISPDEAKKMSASILKGVAESDKFTEEEKRSIVSVIANDLHSSQKPSSIKIAEALKGKSSEMSDEESFEHFAHRVKAPKTSSTAAVEHASVYIQKDAYREAVKQDKMAVKLAQSESKRVEGEAKAESSASVAQAKAQKRTAKAETAAAKAQAKQERTEIKAARVKSKEEAKAIREAAKKRSAEQKAEARARKLASKVATRQAKLEEKRLRAEERKNTVEHRKQRREERRETLRSIRAGVGKVVKPIGATFVGLTSAVFTITQTVFESAALGAKKLYNTVKDKLTPEEQAEIDTAIAEGQAARALPEAGELGQE